SAAVCSSDLSCPATEPKPPKTIAPARSKLTSAMLCNTTRRGLPRASVREDHRRKKEVPRVPPTILPSHHVDQRDSQRTPRLKPVRARLAVPILALAVVATTHAS